MSVRGSTGQSLARTFVLSTLLAAFALLLASCADSPSEPEERAAPDVAGSALVSPPFVGCQYGSHVEGALYEVCIPTEWNGDLVVWAHGYTSPTEDLAVPDDEVDETPISEIVNDLGYAYAATSYRKNGLVAADAVLDLEDLVDVLRPTLNPRYIYLVGASEGGLTTALAIERTGPAFDGGMSTCGPVGNFRKQINHFGDFRVIFDYFFPDVMPGSAIHIPEHLVTDESWKNVYEPAIKAAIATKPHATEQLLKVTGAATDPNDPDSIEETVVGVLWYSFFATNDAVETLGGNPYGNWFRRYRGSDDDRALNRDVDRFQAAPAALAAMQSYETSGRLRTPAVILHTTRDPIVPYWHELLYLGKVLRAGAAWKLTSLPVFRYGHCQFKLAEVLAGFAVLVLRVSAQDLIAQAEVFPDPESQRAFLELARANGANPWILERRQR